MPWGARSASVLARARRDPRSGRPRTFAKIPASNPHDVLKRHCRGTPYRDPSDGTVRIAFQPRARR